MSKDNTGGSHGYNTVRKKATKEQRLHDATCSETRSLDCTVEDADIGGGTLGEKSGHEHRRAQGGDERWEGGRTQLARDPWCSSSALTFFFLTWMLITWHLLKNCLWNLTNVFYTLFCVYMVSTIQSREENILKSIVCITQNYLILTCCPFKNKINGTLEIQVGSPYALSSPPLPLLWSNGDMKLVRILPILVFIIFYTCVPWVTYFLVHVWTSHQFSNACIILPTCFLHRALFVRSVHVRTHKGGSVSPCPVSSSANDDNNEFSWGWSRLIFIKHLAYSKSYMCLHK